MPQNMLKSSQNGKFYVMHTLAQGNKRIVSHITNALVGLLLPETCGILERVPCLPQWFQPPECLVHWIWGTRIQWKENSYLHKTRWKRTSYVFHRDCYLLMRLYRLTSLGKIKFLLAILRLWEGVSSSRASLGHICTVVFRLDWQPSVGYCVGN